jgi:predicted  nucleic acid-binding Zn-ribbon protein
MAMSLDEMIDDLQHNKDLIDKLRKVLMLDNEYAKKNDLIPILEEMKAQREEFSKKFDNVHEELKAQREEMKAQREEFSKKFDNVYEELKAQREEMKAQREEFSKKFDNVYVELKAQREEFSKHFDQVYQEIKDIKLDQKEVKAGIDQVNQRMDKSESYLKVIGGTKLELHSLDFFKAILKAKAIKIGKLVWNEIFSDPKKRLGTTDVQIDIFCEDPLIAVEVTSYVDTLEKLTKFNKKLDFLQEKFKTKPLGVVITYEIHSDISNDAKELLKAKGVKLIALGHNDFFD